MTPHPTEQTSRVVAPTPAAPSRGRRGWLVAAVVTTAVLFLSLALLAASDFPRFGEDSYYYRELALGNWSRVNQPFSSRFLQPVIVRLISGRLHCPVDTVFCTMALLSLGGFVFTLAALVGRLGISPLLLIPSLFCASSLTTLQLAFMPDQFYSLLLGVFFLLLAGGYWNAAAAGLVVLFCSRESTILLSASVVAVLLWRRRSSESKPSAWTVLEFLAATVIGVLINRQVSSHSAGNIHHLNSFVYLLVKAPYNFLKNVLGVEIWTNTLAELYPRYTSLFRVSLPVGLHVGGIRAIGIAEISPLFPCLWLGSALSTFGVLLTVVTRELWLARSPPVDDAERPASHTAPLARIAQPLPRALTGQPLLIQIAAVYGLLSFALVPLLGSATARYVYYAWPAFWLWGLMVLSRRYLPAIQEVRHRTTALLLLLAHLALVWPLVSSGAGIFIRLGAFTPLFVAGLLHAITWTLLNRLDGPRYPAPPPSPPVSSIGSAPAITPS